MQPLAKESILPVSASDCSAQVIEVIPLVMRWMRSEMRRRTMPGLTIPQFRAMTYLSRYAGASLTDLAAHLGLTPPTTSKLVQKLVEQKVVARQVAEDRRRICLSLTEQGVTALAEARLETFRKLENKLKSLPPEELAAVSAALRVLGRIF